MAQLLRSETRGGERAQEIGSSPPDGDVPFVQLATAVELLAKNAPAGSESAVQMLRTSMNAASAACEQAIKAGRQVADQVQAAVTPAAKPAARKAA